MLLLIFVPLAIVAELMHASPLVIFSLSAAAIVPLSGILGHATEELAGHTGSTVGGLIGIIFQTPALQISPAYETSRSTPGSMP